MCVVGCVCVCVCVVNQDDKYKLLYRWLLYFSCSIMFNFLLILIKLKQHFSLSFFVASHPFLFSSACLSFPLLPSEKAVEGEKEVICISFYWSIASFPGTLSGQSIDRICSHSILNLGTFIKVILVGEALNMNSDPKTDFKLQEYISCSRLEKINKVWLSKWSLSSGGRTLAG